MTDDTVSIAQLTAWLGAFESLLLERGDHPSLGHGMSVVRAKLAESHGYDGIGDVFTAVGMTLVGSADEASGPLYGTFFLRFGMDAGEARALDPASLGRALRAGTEGVVARGPAAVGQAAVLEVLSRGIDAYDAEIAHGADAAGAASTGFRSARDGGAVLDADAASAVLLLEALATTLASG
jgi:dihydroxyacetone kinase-like protein